METTWEYLRQSNLTQMVVMQEWDQLSRSDITPQNYNSVRMLLPSVEVLTNNHISCSNQQIVVESFAPKAHAQFFQEHGLLPLMLSDTSTEEVNFSLQQAINLLTRVPPVGSEIGTLVRSILVLQSEDEEIDVSYSHPLLPFTIFVSIDKMQSEEYSLRLAESILHEAMHLKLTLVEKNFPMINVDQQETFYSPWRDCQRPLSGVLHGAFVFRAIYDFYQNLRSLVDPSIHQIIDWRLEDIRKELSALRDFPACQGLTTNGRLLAASLIEMENR